MQNNLYVPLNISNSYCKIGQCGPLNWLQGAYCHKGKNQFSDSIWSINKQMIRQKVQFELKQSRDMLQLWRGANRIKKIILANILIPLIIILISFLYVNYANNVGLSLAIFIALILIFYIMIGIPLTILILLLALYCHWRSTRNQAQKAIRSLNQKLQIEGTNIFLVQKKKCPFSSIKNVQKFQVFERILH